MKDELLVKKEDASFGEVPGALVSNCTTKSARKKGQSNLRNVVYFKGRHAETVWNAMRDKLLKVCQNLSSFPCVTCYSTSDRGVTVKDCFASFYERYGVDNVLLFCLRFFLFVHMHLRYTDLYTYIFYFIHTH